MGLFDKLAGMLKVRKEQVNILVIGLNNSGKSTIVNHFKEADERSSIVVPTVGFSVERFQSEFKHAVQFGNWQREGRNSTGSIELT